MLYIGDMEISSLRSKKIAILGLGENNRHLAEYFRRQKIAFGIFENWKSPDELTGKLDDFEIVFRTPGLPYLSEPIREAEQRGVTIYSQTKLFFDICPAKIIGVTGTKGKGTTATLLAKILKESGLIRQVWLGGNIGNDPFEFIEQIQPGDMVVLELSSFQLQDLKRSPHIAVVLKITPEHLDHHKTFEEYVEAKTNIVRYQKAEDHGIFNYDNAATRGLAKSTRGQVWWNSILRPIEPGCFIENQKILFNSPSVHTRFGSHVEQGGNCEILLDVSDVKLLGRFNLENVTAAIAAAYAAGVSDPEIIKTAVKDFHGLPHRLELVAGINEVKYYNDSFSTTPETAIAALTAMTWPVIMMVGGSEKNSDYGELGKSIAAGQVKALVLIGLTGQRIAAAAKAEGFKGEILDLQSCPMDEIVNGAAKIARPGDVVLLSPAAASFDKFSNYKQRGELFKKFVTRLCDK